jgi:hypothetical protein
MKVIRLPRLMRHRISLGLFPAGPFLVLFFAVGSVFGAAPSGQTIRIRVLDGRNGHPVTTERLNVWVGDKPEDLLLFGEGLGYFPTDKNGEVSVPIPEDHAEWIEIETDYYFDCRPYRKDSPRPAYSVKEVLQSGVVLGNTCGKQRAEPRPGEITYFVRPIHWWEAFQR